MQDIEEIVNPFYRPSADSVFCKALMERNSPDWRALRTCLEEGGTGKEAFELCFVSKRFWLAKWLLKKGVIPGDGPGWMRPYDEPKRLEASDAEWYQVPECKKAHYFSLLKTMRAKGIDLETWRYYFGSAAVDEPAWDPCMIAEALENEEYERVAAILQANYAAREPRVVDWFIEQGYRKGHVVVLYYLAQNLLRYSKDRVPTVEDLNFGVRCTVLLMLRVAQDVMCCKLDVVKAGREEVYAAFAQDAKIWLTARWPADVLATPAAIGDELDKWLAANADMDLPLPTWATCLEVGFVDFYWKKPTAHDVTSFKRCTNIAATRASVAVHVLKMLRTTPTWEAFFSQSPFPSA